MHRDLPIDPLLPEIVSRLRASPRLVLRAPPGAGKTTRVPAALLDAGLAGDRQVMVLEPRRIAARAAAEFVAESRGGAVGREIGYRVRFERRGGRDTRLWFVTEGVFSRSLLGDPYVEDVGVVVLDEFHERHLQGDVALGVVRELQETVRPDLRMVVMSATLDTERVAAFLGDAPVLTSRGRAFPVDVEYAGGRSRGRVAERVAAALARVFESRADRGDVLVFLPGAAAIRRAAAAVAALAEAEGVDVVPLHGDLPLDAQRRAILPGPRRKVVLSTNVAETALTIEGVTTVIDSGLARESRFDPRHGLNRLEEIQISRAAAEQRAGRAGRTRAGRCLRLWTAAEHAERRERDLPEALRLDLATIALELRAWGVRDVSRFAWLDPPRPGALESAGRLLAALGAVDVRSGNLTSVGRRMLELSAPPRLARMLVEAERRGALEGPLAAALASERDILLERRALGARDESPWPAARSDLLLRLDLFRRAERMGFAPAACRSLGLDPQAVHAVARACRQLGRSLAAPGAGEAPCEAEILRSVLAGFPDRVVRRRVRGSPRGVMVGGTGVVLDRASVVREEELFVALDLDAGSRRERSEARVRMASAVERRWLEEMFPDAVRTVREVLFDAAAERVIEREQVLYRDLVLEETVRRDVDAGAAGERIAAEAKRDPARALAVGGEARRLLDRLAFLARAEPELGLPASSDDLLRAAIDVLAPGTRSFAEIRRRDLVAALRSGLSSRQHRALENDAPERHPLPSGRSARIDYPPGKPPILSASIQDLFGLATTPRIAAGRVPVVLEILAPSRRPVQVTDDLGSFWRRTYPEVRKQLRGRYPKHAWPDSPLDLPPRRSRGPA